jgi:uncharacterized membrane protein
MSQDPGNGAPIRYEADLPPRLARYVTWVLRGGVLAASIALLLGVLLWVVEGTPAAAGGAVPLSASALGAQLAHLTPTGFLLLGLLLVVATPLARVLLSLALFLEVRDRPFAWVTLFVFVVLLAGVVLGVHP